MIDIVIDYETAWGTHYSLSKLSYAEYISDKRFHAWGAGIKVGNTKARWVTHDKLQAVLDKIWERFSDEGINLICHNRIAF